VDFVRFTARVDGSEDGELAFQTFPGIYREEAIMLLRDFYMQENTNGTLTPPSHFPIPLIRITPKKSTDS